MNEPKVSIITPSYQQAKYLAATMKSVLQQEYANLEYIVIDGGSTDGSRDIIESFAGKLAYWQSEPDGGQTDAINQGFAKATGEILTWLNSDDTYQPGALKKAVQAFADHPNAVLVYGDANFINGEGKVIGKFPAAQTDHKRLLEGYVHIPQQSAFFKADAWKKVAPLDAGLFFAMDYDLWVRLSSLGELVYIPSDEPWANFRLHNDAKSIAADERCWPEMLKVYDRTGGSKLSIIYLKYIVRTILGPFLRWKRRRWLQRAG